ncbi:MAG: rod shape-determining protein MreC [Acidobacteria bacterium]|nr:rod shape-determining protein MreC [Acidobacteriota bacterium]
MLFSRHRSLIVLTVVLFAQLSLLAYQSRKNQDITPIRYGTLLVVAPLQKSLHVITGTVRSLWLGYIDLRTARRSSQELARELDDLKLANQRLQNDAEQGRRLQALLDFRQQHPDQGVAAQVIGSAASGTSRLLVIDRGEDAGLRPDLPVIVPDGIVGKVLYVFPRAAQILLVTDSNSGVACLLESSRAHGILKGKNTPLGDLVFVPKSEQVAIGDRVLTSGEDGVFPKGLPVGTVVSAQPGSDFWELSIQPLARINQLEEVLVILRDQVETIPSAPAAAGTASADLPSESPETAPEPADRPAAP